MKKLLLILSLCSNLCLMAVAQEDASNLDPLFARGPVERPVSSALSLGVGHGNQRDTYLTNLHYEGVALDLHYDRTRMMRQMKWNNIQTVDFSFLQGDDQGAGLSSVMVGRFRYHFAMHKVWNWQQNSLYVGPYAGIDLGFDYNLKMANSNNPATARLTENLGVSAGSSWNYQIRKQPCRVDLLVQLPVLGMALVPEYGASYYETFYLNHTDQDMHTTSLNNQQDLDVRLTTDLPVSIVPWFGRYGNSVRVGVAYHIETMDINNIITRYSTFQFVLGWTWQYLPYKTPRP